MARILVTGGAGFIGAHTARTLVQRGHTVACIDDFNDYYDPALKRARVETFLMPHDVQISELDIRDRDRLEKVFANGKFDVVCHLAARAGVRASISDPVLYTDVNVNGTMVVLELARVHGVRHVVFASSSSVYGGSQRIPFVEDDPVDRPVSAYAATKKSGELLCHTVHHLYGLSCTCLRFFTAYGPFGRPDMAYFSFTKNILAGQPIDVYNHGKHHRDFTYIDDIVEGVVRAIEKPLGYEIINLGNSDTVDMNRFIQALETSIGKPAEKRMLPMQPGDVEKTHADISKARRLLAFNPQTSIEKGIEHFVRWYRKFYSV